MDAAVVLVEAYHVVLLVEEAFQEEALASLADQEANLQQVDEAQSLVHSVAVTQTFLAVLWAILEAYLVVDLLVDLLEHLVEPELLEAVLLAF